MKTIQVLFVISGLGTGGAELALLRLIRHLPQSISAEVISLTDAGTVGPQLLSMGIPLTTLGMSSGRLSASSFFRLSQHIRRAKPDIVQTWMYHADLLGGLAARLAGVSRVVWGVRHTNVELSLNKVSTILVAKACAWLSGLVPVRIVSCSEAAKLAHQRFGYSADLFCVLPNGIELDQFHPNLKARESVRTELGLALETPLVGLVARYHAQKNHKGFLEAVALVHRTCPHVHFVLVGLGVDAKNATLEESINSHDIAGVVHLLGEREDVPHLMAGLDVLALTSWGEAFPNVLAEAMACGVPCAATEAGDAKLIIGDTGCTVPLGDMPALAQALIHLLNEPVPQRLLRSLRSRAHVAAHFDIGKVAGYYATLYRSLL